MAELLQQSFIMRGTLWMLTFAFYQFTPDYDTSVELEGSHVPDSVIGRVGFIQAFSGLVKWDALFFLKISHEGYVYEKNHAFFPLYPMLIRYTALIFSPLEEWISKDEAHILAGIAISWISFAFSTVFIYKQMISRIGKVMFQDDTYAKWAALLFIFNPASIFMGAVQPLLSYTTSLFTFLANAGIYVLFRNVKIEKDEPTLLEIQVGDRIKAALIFALATATRSNGSLLAIFQVYVAGHFVLKVLQKYGFVWWFIIQEALILGFCLIIHASPIFLVLKYAAGIYCQGEAPSEYCNSLFPNVYNYVQAKYWNVGLFTYWELKQIPNFLLALPMLIISISAIYSYIKSDPKRLVSLGTKCGSPYSQSFTGNPLMIPFILYWLANLLVLIFLANIQIITRILASNPALYWHCGELVVRGKRVIILYFLAYLMVGSLLFSNFYPWT